ncbi:MAG: flagellar type III secretion system pore protein FliP [Gammaproteobacteria bacterium]|nr:flagellar type III secretion system pore protein FliP [Gammaproteobacteria bacterium]
MEKIHLIRSFSKYSIPLFAFILVVLPGLTYSAPGLDALTVTTGPDGEQNWTVTIQAMVLMTVITMLPSMLLMMTSFTRIIIVLAIVRQATGLMQAPPAQVLVGLGIFMTMFIMAPVFDRMYVDGFKPYLDEQIGIKTAVERASIPLHEFMLAQTREKDLTMFSEIAKKGPYNSPEDVPFTVLIPSFVTSELKTAFTIGFLIFIPFLIIDLVVASVLMSMGMMMLSPLIVSMPFKLMLFVLVDGWSMIMGTLASSYYI